MKNEKRTFSKSEIQDLSQKCKEIKGKMINKGWEIIGTKNCCEIEREDFNYLVFDSLLRKSSGPEVDHFAAAFFPKNARAPLFIPRTQYMDHDILVKIREIGQSFYCLSYHYNGRLTNYKKRDRCDDAGGECKCAYSTYASSIFDSDKKREWKRTKLEQIFFD